MKSNFRGNGVYLDTLIATEQEREGICTQSILSFSELEESLER